MINLNTNLSSLITQRSLAKSTLRLNQAIEQMTTGFKINHAKDNAANYNITTNMTTKIGAYMVAEDNCAMGLDLLATANGSLDQISDKLQRLRALAVQTSNGTYGTQSKEAINQEANAIVDEIERIYNTTEYNGIDLLKEESNPLPEPVLYNGFVKEVSRRDTSVMTSFASIDGTVALVDGTYSISTPEEMKKLSEMTQAGLISSGDEFVLANDIDLSQYENWTPIGGVDYSTNPYTNTKGWFLGDFDGNGYTIRNIDSKSPNNQSGGLFTAIYGSSIKNLGIENANIESLRLGGAISGIAYATEIENCYVKSSSIVSHSAGLLVGESYGIKFLDSIVQGEVIGVRVAGVTSYCYDSQIDSCYINVKSVGQKEASGVICNVNKNSNSSINNCHLLNATGNLRGVFGLLTYFDNANLTVSNCTYNAALEGIPIVCEKLGNLNITNTVAVGDANINPLKRFQIGINSRETSQIEVSSICNIDLVESMRYLSHIDDDIEGSNDWRFIESIDSLLLNISQKQIELGAAQNRLESALDEISVQYENLVSSRSTLRDADISEVSSEYIRQQILQQASATLMATANQSPSIALQLI